MIKSFKDKLANKVWNREQTRLPLDFQRRALRKLMALHASVRVEDLRNPPGNRLEALGGDRKGQHSIRVNDRWRLCFRWDGNDAHDVELVDYH